MHDIVKFCVHFLFLLCCSQESSSVEVTPDTVSVCPGELITFKCNTSVTLLRWTVTLSDKSRAPFELLLSPSTMEVVSEHHLVFRAEWTSLSPPCSTFMTNASLALHNAQVKCTAAMTSDTSIIIMRDIPAIQWLNITNMNFSKDSATLTIEWNGRDHAHDNTQYFIVITPPLSILNGSVSNFTTNTSSHSFTIPYNSLHTITITATNCVGNTSTINETFNFIQCQQPNVAANVSVNYNNFRLNGSQAVFSCPEGQALSNREFTSATCTNSGEWSPDLSQLNLQCDYVKDDDTLTTIFQERNPLLIAVVVLCILILLVIVGFVSVIIILLKGRTSHGQGNFRARGQERDSEVGDNADIVELNEDYGSQNQSCSNYSNTTAAVEIIPGSGKLAPNASYELTRIPRAQLVGIERNPAYISTS